MRLRLALCTLALCALAAAQQPPQQPPPKPCTAPEASQFDFWVGDWEASWPAAQGSPAGTGANHIVKTMGGCVIEEHFDASASSGLVGHSVSVYLPRFGKWKQTWVDNQGAYLDFTGEFQDGQMILARPAVTPKGVRVLQRMVWKNITPSAFDWSWEQSTDDGKTWKVLWPIRYTRKKS